MHERTPSFGERTGASKPPPIQIFSLDYRTKVQLFNTLYDTILQSESFYGLSVGRPSIGIENWPRVMKAIWTRGLNQNILEFQPERVKTVVNKLICKDPIEYFSIFDLLEKIFQALDRDSFRLDILIDRFNTTLVTHSVGWRLTTNLQFVAVGNAEELYEIEKVYHHASQIPTINTVATHLSSAVRLLTGPYDIDNLRLSVKESISMVGVIARKISSENDLGRALNRLGKDNLISAALTNKFKQYYNYVNDNDGIRHELMEEPNLNAEEARYFLIACSAFTNYLIEKATKAKLI